MTSLNNGEPRSSGVRSTFEERLSDFAPNVIVQRDGEEIEIPISEFLQEQAHSGSDEKQT